MKKLSLAIIFGFIAFGIIWSYSFYIGSLNYVLNPGSDQRVVVQVNQGATASSVANDLHEKELIRSPFAFKLYLKQNDLMDQIKAGRIVLNESYNLKEIVDSLVEGKSEEFAVTLLEGWNLKQIAEYLEEVGVTTADEFIDCSNLCEFDFDFLPDDYLEGYLYPDTYFVNIATYTNERFISRLIDTLENKLSNTDWSAVEKSSHTFEEIMIMASIVEREERDPDERPMVAGVLWNRFDIDMGLGADATTLYALGRTKGGLNYNDLDVDNPYNTRKYRGLPPTPISNPSISSIRAAIYPEDTDYMYYLHDSDGLVHYGRTLDEHNVNKRKYL